MNSKNLKQRILTHLAEQGIPATEDPWQAFQRGLSQVKADETARRSTGSTLRSSSRVPSSMLRPIPVLLFALLLVISLLAGMSNRALARNLLNFFAPAANDEMPVQTQPKPADLTVIAGQVTTQPTLISPTFTGSVNTASCSAQFNPRCSLQQAQTLIDFPLMEFSELPDGFVYKGAEVEVGRVTAMYGCSQECLLWFEQSKAGSLPSSPEVIGSSAHVETLQWGNIQGEYVEGSYYGMNGSWNSHDGISMLRWQQGNIIYTISALQSQSSPETNLSLKKEDIIQLASNLTTDLSRVRPLNPLDLTSISEARDLAGFEIVEPGILPKGYQFSFATYDAQTHFVCLNYAYNGASYPSLFIRQSPTASLTELNGYPGSNLHTDWVTLTGADKDASLVTGFASPNGACDEDQNIFRAGQALLWRANGMSFEIYAEFPVPFTNAGLKQNELIQLAESLRAKP